MSTLDIVVAQSPAELYGPDARIDWLEGILQSEGVQGAELIVLPELFMTGYNVGDKVVEWAENADGVSSRKIVALSRKHNIAIHYGYVERHQKKLFNSSNCFSKEGKRLGGHRKLLLPPGYEGDYFSGGNCFEIFEINDIKIATLICYDAEFPENFRSVAQLGAHLVLVPTALSSRWAVVAHKLIPTRAFENGVLVCYANHAGKEGEIHYCGASCIVDADGSDIQRAGCHAELLRAVVNKEQVKIAQERLPYLKDVNWLTAGFR